MIESFSLENKYLKQIFQNIQDGIIIMNQERMILMINPSAERLTGWKLQGKVPYCSFCVNRRRHEKENKCYLIQNDEVPYFLSEMPTYHGKKIDVEMSTALMFQDTMNNEKEYLLVLRDQSVKIKEDEARISKMMIKKLIEAQETEHKRLAQELHDGVGQSLFTISVALQAIESYIYDERLNAYIEEVRQELEKAMNDIKSYAYELRPQSLDQLGIVAAIQSLINSVKRNNENITFLFETNTENRCNPTVSINLYRVVQEAIYNCIKYAEAATISIILHESLDGLSLTIADDGIGFNVKSPKNEGLGLKHMSERIYQIGGEFSLESQQTIGTKIFITIPDWKEVVQ